MHGNNTLVQRFWEALYEYGADLILNGNEHVYERFLPQDPERRRSTRPTGSRSSPSARAATCSTASSRHRSRTRVARFNDAHGVIKLMLRPTRLRLAVPADPRQDLDRLRDRELPRQARRAAAAAPAASAAAPAAPAPDARRARTRPRSTPTRHARTGASARRPARRRRTTPALPGHVSPGVTLGRPGALADDADTAVASDGGDGRVSYRRPGRRRTRLRHRRLHRRGVGQDDRRNERAHDRLQEARREHAPLADHGDRRQPQRPRTRSRVHRRTEPSRSRSTDRTSASTTARGTTSWSASTATRGSPSRRRHEHALPAGRRTGQHRQCRRAPPDRQGDRRRGALQGDLDEVALYTGLLPPLACTRTTAPVSTARRT